MRRKTAILLRVVVSLCLILFFLLSMTKGNEDRGDIFSQLIGAFSSASLPWLIPAFFLHVVGLCLISFRWKVLLKAQGISSRYGQLFFFYLMAAFFNNFLPSTVGGDTIRAIESNRNIKSAPTSVVVVILERLTGLLALLIIAFLATMVKVIQGSPDPGIYVILVLTSVLFLLLVFVSHPRIAPIILQFLARFLPAKIAHFLQKAYQAVKVYYEKTMPLIIAIGISLLFQLNMVFYYYLIARALIPDVLLLDYLIKVPILIFLMMVAPVINGIGIRSWTFQELMGFPSAPALAVELIDLGMRLAYGLLGGIVYLFYRRPRSE